MKLINALEEKGQVFPICGFPGIGKSHLSREHGWPDSDSSKFSWSPDDPKVRHPEWPNNYIEHLKSLSGPVLVSTHQEVRDALAAAGIPFWVCYPERECREEYLQRYRDRGSPESFINLLDSKWEEWLCDLEQDERPVGHIVLKPSVFASDKLPVNPQFPWV